MDTTLIEKLQPKKYSFIGNVPGTGNPNLGYLPIFFQLSRILLKVMQLPYMVDGPPSHNTSRFNTLTNCFKKYCLIPVAFLPVSNSNMHMSHRILSNIGALGISNKNCPWYFS